MKIYKQNGIWMTDRLSFGSREIKAHKSFDHAINYSINMKEHDDAIFTYPAYLEKELKNILELAISNVTSDLDKFTRNEKAIMSIIRRFIES